ncbi:NADH:ubiquinone reductase (Na(+)-transporting) subunit D [Sporosalibacterium faouarense]|uniref:NADH:ubiquinone reductase (Na(+)-transporting) subunit D n=1 Tax=Sporosalibacterium faouarense TaxID=516123 RepID=UPI00141C4064|nr:NADH:ubiquinone reductase (Na(+)-transporting) subunit D [Sporosalibacterium faouarense]MTI46420.1 NADH:ubiquinone reductase (Na(+)-transporting) subunit D [Bacillota bacterium]
MDNTKVRKIFTLGVWGDNPIFRQILGICSALAVTNLMLNSLVMGLGLIFVTSFSELTVSLIRKFTPKHIRMMVQVLIISSFVIIVDIFLKAYYPEMSEALGPYVGLIITNCIIMGRCESYAQNNPPIYAFLDGVASGTGYAIILLIIAFFRELLGFGSIFGIQVLGAWWTNWIVMIMAPGAFFMLGIVIWVARSLSPEDEESNKQEVAKA